MPNSEKVPLSWSRSDPEQRLAFRGGRFTRVNGLLTMILGSLLSVGFYAILMPIGDTKFAQMFTERGPTQYATVFLSSWSLAILLLKWRKLRFQRRALDYPVVPNDHDFVLSPMTVDCVVQEMYATVDNPKHFILFNRIAIALSNLRNLGQVTEVDGLLRSQANQDESSIETSYSLVHGFVWAIPVLGFIGTVLGLSDAIGAFSGVLGTAKDIGEISQSLRGVTSGLSTAFETTLVALVAALVIQLLLTSLKKAEEEFLDECTEYCLKHVVSRLRLLPYEAGVA